MSGSEIRDVDIELGDEISKMLYEASKLTYGNRPGFYEDMGGSFSGWRAFDPDYYHTPEKIGKGNKIWQNLGADGIGTKTEVYERALYHEGAAHDLNAMLGDDALVRGAEPLALITILDIRDLPKKGEDPTNFLQLLKTLGIGYVDAAGLGGVVVVGGEMAQLGTRVQGYIHPSIPVHDNLNYNWGGVVFWVANSARMLTGDKIKPGDEIIGLAEPGFRSNGITDVRKALLKEHGNDWHNQRVAGLGNKTLGELVAIPSTIYARFVTDLTGGFDIRREPKADISGFVHVTGGGIPSKLGRALQPTNGLGAELYDLIGPPLAMQYVQELREFDDRTAYGKWHMGSGGMVITPEGDKVIKLAETFGIHAKHIGQITNSGIITVHSCGVKTPGKILKFKI